MSCGPRGATAAAPHHHGAGGSARFIIPLKFWLSENEVTREGFQCRTSAFPDSEHIPALYSMHNSEAELRVSDSFQQIKEELNTSEYCRCHLRACVSFSLFYSTFATRPLCVFFLLKEHYFTRANHVITSAYFPFNKSLKVLRTQAPEWHAALSSLCCGSRGAVRASSFWEGKKKDN